MPKAYVKKGKTNNWTDAQLVAAMKAAQSKELSVRSAAAKYGIPKSTLQDHVQGISTKRYGGPPTVLTADEEKEVVRSCLAMQQFGFPLTRDFVKVALRDFLKARGRSNQFTDGVPGRSWWGGFFRRHPELVERKPEHLPRERAQAAKPEVREHYKTNNTIHCPSMYHQEYERESILLPIILIV